MFSFRVPLIFRNREKKAESTPPDSSPAKCGPGHQTGLHGEVLYGLGGMGDASLCLRCGLDTYASIQPRESIREAVAPDDWPAIEAARALQIHAR